MKTTLIALPILGLFSTSTVATFVVGAWTHATGAGSSRDSFISTGRIYTVFFEWKTSLSMLSFSRSWTERKERILHGRSLPTAGTGQSEPAKDRMDSGRKVVVRSRHQKVRSRGKWKPYVLQTLQKSHFLTYLVAPWFDQKIPGCDPNLRIQKSNENVFGRVVDLAKPNEENGACYMFVEGTNGPEHYAYCKTGAGKVVYVPQLICLTNKCGGTYVRDRRRDPEKVFMPVPNKPEAISAIAKPHQTAAPMKIQVIYKA